MGARKLQAALGVLSLAVLVLAGCGSSSSDEDSTTSVKDSLPEGPTRQFYVPGEDNSVQLFGHEAAPSVRETASRVVQAWLRARATHDWDEDCRHLSWETVNYAITSATTLGQRMVRDCGKALAIIAAKGPDVSRRYNMAGSVASLRLEEGRGYAQYHGDEGRDWIVPVRQENGVWKISALDPIERFK